MTDKSVQEESQEREIRELPRIEPDEDDDESTVIIEPIEVSPDQTPGESKPDPKSWRDRDIITVHVDALRDDWRKNREKYRDPAVFAQAMIQARKLDIALEWAQYEQDHPEDYNRAVAEALGEMMNEQGRTYAQDRERPPQWGIES